jgi:DNA polymerase III subunit delta
VRTTPESLQAALDKGALPRVCLVTGVEPLLIDEACAVVRERARRDGYGDREVHFVERGFDWEALLADAQSLSLFSHLRLIELKLRNAPDATAAKNLARLAAEPPADTVLLVAVELELKSQKAAWVGEFEKHGLLVIGMPVERGRLPAWITRRLQQRGVMLDETAAELIADRVEGNLLAAQQEIERIALLRPAATLDAKAVAELVADNARFDVFELTAAALLGNAPRALRILEGLRGEGVEPPLILWALVNDLRALSRVALRAERDDNLDGVFRSEGIWSNRQGPLRVALQRVRRRDIESLLGTAARADRIAKGSLPGEAWVELSGLIARMAGVALVAA